MAHEDLDPIQLRNQVAFLEAEVSELRLRLNQHPGATHQLEQRLTDTQRSLAAVTSQNERLASTLREARDAFATSQVARATLGDDVVDHYTNMADVELKAFESAVTDWERRRSFERM